MKLLTCQRNGGLFLAGQPVTGRSRSRAIAEKWKRAGFRLDLIDWRDQPDIFGASPVRSSLNPYEVLYVVTRSD